MTVLPVWSNKEPPDTTDSQTEMLFSKTTSAPFFFDFHNADLGNYILCGVLGE
jgi:hypothetical protein